MQCPVLRRDDGCLVGPVLVEAALVPQETIDQRRVKRTEAAEEDEQMAARDDSGRVELQAADRLDEGMDVVSRDAFRARAAQALARNGQLPRALDPDLAAHDRELCLSQSGARHA